MMRKIRWAILSMSVCVAGVLVLQFYFAYASFGVQKDLFARQANEAFRDAVDSVKIDRENRILSDFRDLISDTTFIRITSKVNKDYGTTVFTLAEMTPASKGQTQVSMSIETFTLKVEPITPAARQVFIDHMVETARADLKKGYVFYYTQKLGDSLSKAQYDIPMDTARIRSRFVRELSRLDMPADFRLSQHPNATLFQTKPINLALKTNVPPTYLYASFNNTERFIFGRLKWVLAGSLLMFLVVVSCFAYTLRIMLSQQKLSAIKDDFIRNMTHELHTPLASLTVTAESLRRFDHDENTRQTYIDIMLLQVKRLGKLTSEILETARAGNEASRAIETVDVANLVDEAIALFPCANIRLDDHVRGISIRANKNDLLKMLANLLDNGLKYNPNQNREIRIEARAAERTIFLDIRDNGPGIPDAEKARIFDAFYRIATGNRHDVKGYGLGLHFVRQVVKSHGGKIEVSNNPESGTTFSVTLPR